MQVGGRGGGESWLGYQVVRPKLITRGEAVSSIVASLGLEVVFTAVFTNNRLRGHNTSAYALAEAPGGSLHGFLYSTDNVLTEIGVPTRPVGHNMCGRTVAAMLDASFKYMYKAGVLPETSPAKPFRHQAGPLVELACGDETLDEELSRYETGRRRSDRTCGDIQGGRVQHDEVPQSSRYGAVSCATGGDNEQVVRRQGGDGPVHRGDEASVPYDVP